MFLPTGNSGNRQNVQPGQPLPQLHDNQGHKVSLQVKYSIYSMYRCGRLDTCVKVINNENETSILIRSKSTYIYKLRFVRLGGGKIKVMQNNKTN